MSKKIVIAGGSGFMGKAISQHYISKDYQVVVFTRAAAKKEKGVEFVQWDGRQIGDWLKHINGADLLVNLTGKSVNCRYTEENKRLILSSRVDATTILGEAIQKVDSPPKLWVNASTATIYD